MTREIITLQAGQCGNQIGMEFWKTLCSEHGIGKDGLLEEHILDEEPDDKKDVFFYQADDTRFVPRSIMIDLEPRVINKIKTGEYKDLFNFESYLLSKDGGGAANNWVCGYDNANCIKEEMLEMIDRETEGSDSLEAFMLVHSIAGGTGSGLGSYLLEHISDYYPKKLIKTYSVFPDLDSGDHVVVQPYNSILSLKRLIMNCDCTTVFDNFALDKIVHNTLKTEDTNFDVINKLVSTVMSSATSTLRFPGFSNYDMIGLISPLMTLPTCHFITTSYTPFTRSNTKISDLHRATISETIRRLCSSKNRLVTIPNLKTGTIHENNGCNLSVLNIIQGDFNLDEAYSFFNRMKEMNKINFVPWGLDPIQIIPANKSPYTTEKHKLSGLMMANSTSIKNVLHKIKQDFQNLLKKKAYLENYKKSDIFQNIVEEFEESKEIVQSVIDDYNSSESPDFMNLSTDFYE